jgi:hypothetical protein
MNTSGVNTLLEDFVDRFVEVTAKYSFDGISDDGNHTSVICQMHPTEVLIIRHD